MKKLFYLLTFFIGLIACNNNSSTANSNSSSDSGTSKDPADNKSSSAMAGGRYGIKSARVVTVTALPNGMGNTEATLYFDNYGKDSYTETVSNITMKGVPPQPKQFSIMEGEYIYSWTDGNKTGSKIKLDINKNIANLDFEKLGKEMSEQMKVKKTGTETFLGKTCDVYEMDNSQLGKGKFLLWKNITMLSDMTTMGMKVKVEATEVEENPSIDPSKFKVPSDVDFKEMSMKF